MSRFVRRLALAMTAGVLLTAGGPLLAQDESGAGATDTAEGRQIWTYSGCASCHGPAGHGGTHQDYPPGPGLRSPDITRDGLVEAIACGRPGSLMPGWLRGAYTETSCYGLDPGRVPPGTQVVELYDADQIETLADFIISEFWQE